MSEALRPFDPAQGRLRSGRVYLGLGSNLGDREAMLRLAIDGLIASVHLERVSELYETEPFGVADQPWFLNAACVGQTDLEPLDLLHACKELETALGRQPGPRFGPRLIDIDLLAYDDLVMETAELILPHPRLHERGFVLAPLMDIARDWRHPIMGRTVRELYEAGSHSVVQRIGWRKEPSLVVRSGFQPDPPPLIESTGSGGSHV